MTRFRRWRARMAARFNEIGRDLQYPLLWHATDPAERLGPRPRWWRLPLCWWRGHRYGSEDRGYFEIVEHRADFCRCCLGEVVGRTRWAELEPRPLECFDDYDWNED